MDNNSDKHFVVVYKTTVSIILYEMLYTGIIALFAYVIFTINVLWAQILLSLCIVLTFVMCLQLLKHAKDRIVITPRNLTLTNTYTKSRHGKWRNATKVDIPWHEIKDLSSDFDFDFGLTFNRISIHKNVMVKLRNGMLYYIDSDLYDVFFLKRKLNAFWIEYGRKR